MRRISQVLGRWGFIASITALAYFPYNGGTAMGAVIPVDPSNYLGRIAALRPGDTLVLSPGNYEGLPVYDLNGTPSSPIVITGPDVGPRPVILGTSGSNTVRLRNASYVTIRNLEVDCRNLGGDGVNSQGVTHHITIDNLYIHAFSDDQGTVGIATNQAPVWNWIIRNNVIADGGTGMYLGNSDGNQPFIAGTIENNLFYDTIGYNVQIKHQNPRPTDVPGMPTGDSRTIIRNNVFSKSANSSTGALVRPNLLVGHFPVSGAGTNDVYEIYGNFFYQNPVGESLFQGEGNIALYNNLFFNSLGPAVVVQPHNDVPKMVRIFNNTIVARDSGIRVSGGSPDYQQKVIGNAVFSATPISASDQAGNIVDTYANASNYLANPFGSPGNLDLYPLAGKLTGTSLDTATFNTFTEWDRDFNRKIRVGYRYRGAYDGEGRNPGWLPTLERKPAGGSAVNVYPSSPTNLRVQ